MDDMRIVFLVIGSIAIAALMIHGFYTVQKNKPKPKNRRVAAAKKANKAPTRVAPELDPEPTPEPLTAVEPVLDAELNASPAIKAEPELTTPLQAEVEPSQPSLLQEELAPIPEAKAKVSKPRSAPRREPKVDTEQIEFDLEPAQPTADEPKFSATVTAETGPAEAATDTIKVDMEKPPAHLTMESTEEQQPLDLDAAIDTQPSASEAAHVNEPHEASADGTNTQTQSEPEQQTASADNGQVDAEPTDVLVLYVVGKSGSAIKGEELLPNLTAMGFKFGDMDIFHRHQHSAGTGPVLYSLANMLQPGTFDLDQMEQFSTDGVLLFLTLPTNNDARVAFSMMLGNAQGLADMHGGQVLDDKQQPWTDAAQEGYMQRIQQAESLANA